MWKKCSLTGQNSVWKLQFRFRGGKKHFFICQEWSSPRAPNVLGPPLCVRESVFVCVWERKRLSKKESELHYKHHVSCRPIHMDVLYWITMCYTHLDKSWHFYFSSCSHNSLCRYNSRFLRQPRVWFRTTAGHICNGFPFRVRTESNGMIKARDTPNRCRRTSSDKRLTVCTTFVLYRSIRSTYDIIVVSGVFKHVV